MKNLITVRKGTHLAFSQMKNQFNNWELTAMVKHLTGRAFLQDGTIMRRLRELRNDCFINYIVYDNNKGLYKKVHIFNELENPWIKGNKILLTDEQVIDELIIITKTSETQFYDISLSVLEQMNESDRYDILAKNGYERLS